MSEFRRLGAEPPAIKSQAELLQRLRDRQAPEADHALTPPRSAQNLAAERSAEQDRRIADLRNGLTAAQQDLEVQHSFARLFGHARTSFDRER